MRPKLAENICRKIVRNRKNALRSYCNDFWVSSARGEAKYFPSAKDRASALFKSAKDSKRFPLIPAFFISSNVFGSAQKFNSFLLFSRFLDAVRHCTISSFDK